MSGNTLANPKFKDGERLRTYDYVVANPPFSDKTWSTGTYSRRPISTSDSPGGRHRASKATTPICCTSFAASRKKAKEPAFCRTAFCFAATPKPSFARNWLNSGYLKGIIGLPANLFYGTGIPACILVLDKENATARKGVFMIDASKGFIKDGNKNRLREQDIHRIVDTFNRQDESNPRYARMVTGRGNQRPQKRLQPEPAALHRQQRTGRHAGHRRSPAMAGFPTATSTHWIAYWDVIPGVRDSLIKRADRAGYCQLRVPIADVKQTIYDHDEFADFIKSTTKLFTKWKKANHPTADRI